MSGHLEEEALRLGWTKVEEQDIKGGLVSRDWEITFELDGFTIKHGVNCSLEDMYDWILQLQGVFNISGKKATVVTAAPALSNAPAPTNSNIDGAVIEQQPNFDMNQAKYPTRRDANKIVAGLMCPFNSEKELSPTKEDWARYNDQDGMLDNYFCTKVQDDNGNYISPPNCTRGAECGKTIWRRQAQQAV